MTQQRPLFGAHMPTAGGVHHAITSGKAIGCEVVQVFTASPRQWRSPTLKEDAITAYKDACRVCGIPLTVAHDSYLINMAAAEGGDVQTKSMAAFRGEVERAEAFGIQYLVTHPGAHTGDGVDVGLARIIKAFDQIHAETAGYKVKVAIEVTAGQGTLLGSKFDEVAAILNGVREPDRMVVCVDTCHLLASGYDIRTADAYEETMSVFDRVVGLQKLKVVHANDSQKGLGSHLDRHTHIGEGEIGTEGFRLLVNDPRMAGLPIIIETPEAETMHGINVQRLKDLVAA